ncbi:OmpH family outer membrane protein [Saprospiraceae bacterium]|jgi:outer membrane protein|nr:OmpH family outer membrane protein [Bacteroidota bacterium]MDB4727738.1 OmpH family outer membrane protein [Saprospiraceae bacterium]MDF1863262.1 OmpH family outer membrane protein [Saprospiraceae bacterium]
MMKKLLKMGGFLMAFMLMVGSVQAQKFGYVDSGAILNEMVEVKQMRSNLEGFKTQLEKKAQGMLTEFQQKQQDAATKKQAGTLSPIEEETVLKELQEKEQEIYKYQGESQQKLAEKEQELLNPILERVNTAINDIAKADGLQFVFDARSGVILYADETTDITSKVKSKLGI